MVKLWEVGYLINYSNWDADGNRWDEQHIITYGIVRCTEEYLKDVLGKYKPYLICEKNDPKCIVEESGKFVYREIVPMKTFDPEIIYDKIGRPYNDDRPFGEFSDEYLGALVKVENKDLTLKDGNLFVSYSPFLDITKDFKEVN